jgi:hypothetical protein
MKNTTNIRSAGFVILQCGSINICNANNNNGLKILIFQEFGFQIQTDGYYLCKKLK